jgi:hypothetical protein
MVNRFLAAAVALCWAGAAFGQAAVPALPAGAAPAGGPINLIGSGTSGQYDALITVTGGGSVAGQGQAKYSAGMHQFFGLDGSEQARIITMQSAVDYTFQQGGQSGFGATFGCQSATDANVDCVVAAQGAGGIYLGNGSGLGLLVGDPGALITSNLTFYGGTAASSPIISSPTNINFNLGTSGFAVFEQGSAVSAEIGGTASLGAYLILGAGNSATQAVISSGGGTGGNTNLYIRGGGTGSVILANAQGTYMTLLNSNANTITGSLNIRSAGATTPVFLYPSSATNMSFSPNGSALATSATLGFTFLATMPGKNSATPLNASLANGAAMYWDSTDSELCFYDTARHCSAAFSN